MENASEQSAQRFFLRADGAEAGELISVATLDDEVSIKHSDSESIILCSDEPLPLLNALRRIRDDSGRIQGGLHFGRAVSLTVDSCPLRETLEFLVKCAPVGESLVTGPFYNRLDAAGEAVLNASLDPLGNYRLQGGASRMEIYAVRFSERPSTQLCVGSTNLPQKRGVLFGRQPEIEALRRKLNETDTVYVNGPPGIGKSRLTVAYARKFRGRRPDWDIGYFDLGSAVSFQDICRVISSEMGISFQSDSNRQQRLTTLKSVLTNRRRVFCILDNVEHLEPELEQLIDELRDVDADVQWLISSRRPLGRPESDSLELGPLEESSAIDLFIAGARQGRMDFRLTSERLESIVEIIRCLNANPMAIELAARSLKTTSLDKLEKRLRDNISDTVSGDEATAQIVGSLRAFLNDMQTQILRQCVIFRGPFTKTDVQSLASEDSQQRVGKVFDTLVERGLIQSVSGPDKKLPILYELPRTIRDTLDLEKFSDKSRLQERFVKHYSKFAERLNNQLKTPRQPVAVRQLSRQYQHVEKAFDLAEETGSSHIYPLGIALHQLYHLRGAPARDMNLMERASKIADKNESSARKIQFEILRMQPALLLESTSDVAVRLDELIKSFNEQRVAVETRTRAYRCYAFALCTKGDFKEAEQVVRKGINLAASQNQYEEAALFVEKTRIKWQSGKDSATDVGGTAYELAKEIGQPKLIADACIQLGVAHQFQQEYSKAARVLEEALSLVKRLSAHQYLVRIHHRIGELALQEAEFSRAYRHLSRALQITRSFLGDGTLIAQEIHLNLGCLALEQVDFESAKSHLSNAYRAYRQSHRSWWAFAASSRLAASLAGLGQFQRANQIFDKALDWKKEVDLPGINAVYRIFRLVLKIANVHYGHTPESELPSVGDELKELSEVHQGHLHVEEAIRPVRAYLQEVRRNDNNDAQMTSRVLRVQTQCRKFRPPGGEVQDISALTAPRRLLKKLVDERLEAPGRSISVFELADAGWPNEELPPDTAKNRLYVAIRRLRSSGLEDLIKNETGGYYLSPSVSIRRVDQL